MGLFFRKLLISPYVWLHSLSVTELEKNFRGRNIKNFNSQQFHFLEDVSSGGGGVVAVDEAVVVVVGRVAGVEVVSISHTGQTFPPAVSEERGVVRVVQIIGGGETDRSGEMAVRIVL